MQLGSTLALGARGRRFKSCRRDCVIMVVVMKIVLTGNNQAEVSEAIFEAMKRWPMYKTLATSVRDIVFTDEKAKDVSPDFLKTIDGLNDEEKTLMYRNYMIGSQYDKHKNEEFMFFNGGTIDVLIDAIIGNLNDTVSNKVVEKCIYYNKKLLRNIDAIYWIPDANFWLDVEQQNKGDEEEGEDKEKEEIKVTLTEQEQKRERAYWNLLQDYQFNIEATPYFNSEDTPLYAMVDGEPCVALSEIIGDNGRLAGESISPEDEQRIQELLKKSPEYLQALKESELGARYDLTKQ